MNKREVVTVMGVIDASSEHGEAFITSFRESDGFVNEECYDLIEVLEGFDKKTIKITIEMEG